jgi:hypothetical protein
MIVFVGEKRSKRAIELRVTWEDGALASKTLHRALSRIGLTDRIIFANLWGDHGYIDLETIELLRLSVRRRRTIVGLGRVVQARLRSLGIPHKKMIHPAARGAIRAQETYINYVKVILTSPAGEYRWTPKRK